MACMDARLDPVRVLDLQPGDAHVIRNAGGVVTEDVIRSLVISQQLLGTHEVVLIHHTDCGMLTVTDKALHDRVEGETGVRPPFSFLGFDDLETDVRTSIARVRENPFLARTRTVRGYVWEVETGRLRPVD